MTDLTKRGEVVAALREKMRADRDRRLTEQMADRAEAARVRRGMTVAVSAAIWDDFLNPDVTTMEAEVLGTGSRRPQTDRYGRTVYDGLTPEQVTELGEYLTDRAEMLLGQGVQDPDDSMEKRERSMMRRAARLGTTLIKQARQFPGQTPTA
jgi:hypothetical protein